MEISDSSAVSSSLQKAVGTENQTKPVQLEGNKPLEGEGPFIEQNVKAINEIMSDPATVKEVVERFGQFMETVSSSLKISVDDDLSKVVLKVVNSENDETIRQIPTEEVLALMKRMRDLSEEFFGDAKGLLVENKV